MSGTGSGIAGTVDGSFFKEPAWVDASKPAGATTLGVPTWRAWALGVLQGQHILYSPNLVWIAITAAVYVAFPYDLQAARELRLDWVLRRFGVHFCVVLAYFAFWAVAARRVCARKYNPRHRTSVGEYAHDAWYWLWGVVQWCAWEAAYMHLWATGRLPYAPDAEAFSAARLPWTLAWVAAVPVWRAFHFYFSHRFIHFRALYRHIHSLHHRNPDPEPFAGLCMHPIEHLYYLSTVGLSAYVRLSPFHFLYNGMHVMLSPAASHSGMEDHFQSDQFHFTHHARFECNYGASSFPIDTLFRTLRPRVHDGEAKAEAKGEAKADESPPVPWARRLATALTPEPGAGVYFGFTAALAAAMVDAVVRGGDARTAPPSPELAAAMLSLSPIAVALLLNFASGDRMSPLWPFQKDPLWSLALHLLVGAWMSAAPVYDTLAPLLTPPAGAPPLCTLHAGCVAA